MYKNVNAIDAENTIIVDKPTWEILQNALGEVISSAAVRASVDMRRCLPE